MFQSIFILLILFLSIKQYSSLDNDKQTCKSEFFTILADKMPWNSESESCEISFNKANDRILSLAYAMKTMNTTLTIYTSFTNINLCISKYFNNLKHIKIKSFNGNDLLNEFNYNNNVRNRMNSWNLTGYARSSDIIRLLLAYKYEQIYIDTDIYFIDYNITSYIHSFVSIAIWQDIENSIEISNCAFCLNKMVLNDLIIYQRNRIEHGSSTYLYTELGPSMFHKVLINKLYSVSLYSQNHPKEKNFNIIAKSILLYNHKFLHLTTAIRKSHTHLKQQQIGYKIVKLYHNLLNNTTKMEIIK